MSTKDQTFQKALMLVGSLILVINLSFQSLIGLIGNATGLGGDIIGPIIVYTPLTLGTFLSLCKAPEIVRYLRRSHAPIYAVATALSLICIVALFIASSISRFHLSLLHQINPDYLMYGPMHGLSGNANWVDIWEKSEGNIRWRAVSMLTVILGGFLDLYGVQGFLTSIIVGVFLAWSWKHLELSDNAFYKLLAIVILFFLTTFPMAYVASLLE